MAQARGAIEPLAAFQGPPQAYLDGGRTRLLPGHAAAYFQFLVEKDLFLPLPCGCDPEGKLIKQPASVLRSVRFAEQISDAGQNEALSRGPHLFYSYRPS